MIAKSLWFNGEPPRARIIIEPLAILEERELTWAKKKAEHFLQLESQNHHLSFNLDLEVHQNAPRAKTIRTFRYYQPARYGKA